MATTTTTEAQDDGFTWVKTLLPTLPLPRNQDREEIVTENLVIRPWTLADTPAFHVLRTQPEVMVWTSQKRPDRDLAETEGKLRLYTAPNDETTFNFAICDRQTGELIGAGGNHVRESEYGWPELGYILRKEYWGRGLATEFLRGFLGAYIKLPRSQVELRVTTSSIVPSLADADMAEEVLLAQVDASNIRSQGVIKKFNFVSFAELIEHDADDPSKSLTLAAYRYHPARAASAM